MQVSEGSRLCALAHKFSNTLADTPHFTLIFFLLKNNIFHFQVNDIWHEVCICAWHGTRSSIVQIFSFVFRYRLHDMFGTPRFATTNFFQRMAVCLQLLYKAQRWRSYQCWCFSLYVDRWNFVYWTRGNHNGDAYKGNKNLTSTVQATCGFCACVAGYEISSFA